MTKPNPFICLDCAIDTSDIGEYYMLKDGVWLEANPAERGMLCIGCLEYRLNRQLAPADFEDAPVNDPGFYHEMSQRLLSRTRFKPQTLEMHDYQYESPLAHVNGNGKTSGR